MSGTSLDGVDLAIVDFSNHPPELIHCCTRPYEASLQQRLRQLTRSETNTIDNLCRLDIEVARYYAEVINQTLKSSNIKADSIRAIGNHGQTIRHSPVIDPTYTLQIGDPNTLAALTGITTVADFRRRDMALGGQGAPLAPAFHQFLFHSSQNNRAIINIGGIANITYLPADPEQDVIGFDTGPGNTFLDYWIHHRQKIRFDHNGDWAASGQVIDELLQAMLAGEDYFRQRPAKSTGTEYFSPAWLGRYLGKDYPAADVQATLTELTATTIVTGLRQLPEEVENCFVCGGGAHNLHLMQKLQQKLQPCKVSSTTELGMNPDYVEAVAFAWLARQTLHHRPGNLPSVTLASTPAILGGIFPGKTGI